MRARNEEIRARLLEAYAQLSPVEQAIVQTCAIISEPVTSKMVRVCLLRCSLDCLDANALTTQVFNASLAKLKRQGFLDEHCRVPEAFQEVAARLALKAGHFMIIARTVRSELPVKVKDATPVEQKCYRFLREIRIGFYSKDISHLQENLLLFEDCRSQFSGPSPLARICNNPFEERWFVSLPIYLQFHALIDIFRFSLLNLEPVDLPLAYLKRPEVLEAIPPEGRPSFYYLLISQLLLQNQVQQASELMSRAGDISSFGLSGWLHFIQGRNNQALALFEIDLKLLRQTNDRKKAYFTGFEGVLFILAQLKSGEFSRFPRIREVVEAVDQLQPGNVFRPTYSLLLAAIEILEGEYELARLRLLNYQNLPATDHIFTLFLALLTYWLDGALNPRLTARLGESFDLARQNGYGWLALEVAELLNRNDFRPEFLQEFITRQRQETGVAPLAEVVKPEEQWRRALNALDSAAVLVSKCKRPAASQQPHRHGSRLAWFIDYDAATAVIIAVPREQKVTVKGKWTKGRSVALKKLYHPEKIPFLSDADRRICRSIIFEQDQWGGSFRLDMDQALPAMISHPFLFLLQAPAVAVEFLKGEPELRVHKTAEHLVLELFPEVLGERVIPVQESPTRFRIIEISPELQPIVDILDERGLKIPIQARQQVEEVIASISSVMTVHSAIGAASGDVDEVTADSSICVHLLPVGRGFRLAMYVKPFHDGTLYLKPGQGSKTVIAEVKGQRLQARRNLALEAANALRLERYCPSLEARETQDLEWLLQEPEECLQALLELKEFPDELKIEWPEGQKLTVSHQASFDQLQIKIMGKRNWFEVSGELVLDDSLVLDMQRLIILARKTPSRFIPLGEGRFVALTQEFRKRLTELDNFADVREDGVKVHALASLALEDLVVSGVKVQSDKSWQEHLQRLDHIQELQPEVPSTLQAELRDYQVEGYKWLARLACWGVGACLADDMGLGKTVQALALILERAGNGPCLVVAPTSVCLNWQIEANRFAPTLNVVMLGGKEREKMVLDLHGFDILVTSYSLLQQEIELLIAVKWEVIVLDEAQAIKNLATKRSQAAMALDGHFKLITTGTPIENHLGELWNLYNFINPGLLGSLEQFNQRFAIPIERYEDHTARRRLKRLISPFILRRLKSQVLEELPPRTEIVLHVDMSPEEMAFYETLRRQAVKKLEEIESAIGRKHLQILVEIMKLRRACCNPQLVAPDANIPSSKLELFHKVIDELIENRHKALVFSQFVGHLEIIRRSLDEKNIQYQYLDGSTPAGQRRKIVDAFQAGRGDLFLISLKAGGVGLNLTAADYVIHMDPWWNPAVEDQASDRAHRIGQIHPVTVYRLVCRNSIEEKIVELHKHKRDLADSLLDGADISGKMSADDLMALLKEAGEG